MELKPCPFCGGKAVIEQKGIEIMETNRDSVRFDFSIRCLNCKATAPGAYGCIAANLSRDGDVNVWHDDRPSAILSWNRRQTMYDELVKELREAEKRAKEIYTNPYRFVPYYGKAADAIEQLGKDLERSKEWEKFWEKEANEALKKFQTTVASIPRWIPVTERLPEAERKSYWVCTDTGYQCECRWTNNQFGIIESDEWGWSIFDIPQYQKVVAWMPLPKPYEPPKEG